MNTNSNTYTVIYSIILVVIVAAVLAFAAMFLKPTQDANVKKDTISQILTAATFTGVEDANILDTYRQEIESAILVDMDGNKVADLDIQDCEVYGTSDLKRQIAAEQKALPVYIFKNGITVVPCYGAGLWGPIWGYVGFEGDLKTIKAVCFGHKGETPGLGAKIADEPSFAEAFVGKQVGTGEILFEVAKPANRQTENNGVDAISGATITSQALGKTLNQWFGFYQNYFAKNAAKNHFNIQEAFVKSRLGEEEYERLKAMDEQSINSTNYDAIVLDKLIEHFGEERGKELHEKLLKKMSEYNQSSFRINDDNVVELIVFDEEEIKYVNVEE